MEPNVWYRVAPQQFDKKTTQIALMCPNDQCPLHYSLGIPSSTLIKATINGGMTALSCPQCHSLISIVPPAHLTN